MSPDAVSPDAVAIIGFVVLFALMLLRVPVGMAMGLVGVSGLSAAAPRSSWSARPRCAR